MSEDRIAALAATAAAALLLVPAAGAHGNGPSGPKGYESVVTAVRPKVPGLAVTVLGGEERIRLQNRTGETIVVAGYEGEPYLRFSQDGISRNERSPAAWLNAARFGGVPVPLAADPKAPPAWSRLGRGSTWAWHDHRAHWMSPKPPPTVAGAPAERHHVLDWRIPITVGGKPVDILGSLDYRPPSGRNWPALAVFVVGFGTVAGALLVLVLARPRR
jgi:hypothetical protein